MAVTETGALLRRLVRIDSVNPPGNEAAVAAEIADWLGERGISARMIELAPGRCNLVAEVNGAGPGRTIVLNTHMDVVAAGPGWASGPFAGEVRDGRLYGRGAADAKGPLAAMAVALVRLKGRSDWRGRAVLAAVTDEEGRSGGARALLEDFAADAAIVGEPTSLEIVTCHKGSVRPVVEITGRGAHAAMPQDGRNAVLGLGRLLRLVEDHAVALKRLAHPIVGAPTIVPVLVSGGEALNMVPERCRVTFDRRLVPGETEESALSSLQAVLDAFNRGNPGLEARVAELAPSTGGPSETPDDDSLVRLGVGALGGLGQPTSVGGMQVNCDMSHFRRAGMATIVYGPGEPRQMHVVDESIDLEELERGARGYEAMAVAYLNGGDA